MNEIDDLKTIYDNFFKNCEVGHYCDKEIDSDKIIDCKYKELQTMYEHNYVKSYSLNITKSYFTNTNRLLIIGQEKRDVKQYEFEEYDKDHRIPHPDKQNKHWIGTLMTVIKFNNNELTEEELNDIQITKLCDENFVEYCDKNNLDIDFAFTNYFKCAFTHTKEWTDMWHSPEMCKNCGKLLYKEINELKPNLIIKQGKFANQFFKEYYNLVEIDQKPKEKIKNKNYKMFLYRSQYDNGEYFYIIDAYHPCCKCFNWQTHKKYLYDLIDKYYDCIKSNK